MIDQNILYSECPCGSGKKFKFCCYPEVRSSLPRNPSRADVTTAIRKRGVMKRSAEKEGEIAVVDLDRFHELIGRGLRYMHAGDYEGAKRAFLEARDNCDLIPAAYNDLALCELVQGHLEEAERWIHEVVRRFPMENPFGLAMLADLRYLKGDVVGARDVLERAEQLEPPSADQAVRVCESLAHFMDHERIIRYAEKSGYDDDPDMALFHGVALANSGRYDEAVRALRIAKGGRQPEYVERVIREVTDGGRSTTICGNWMYLTPQTFSLYAGLLKQLKESGGEQVDLSADVIAELVEVETNGGVLDPATAVKLLSTCVCSRSERLLNAFRSNAKYPKSVREEAARTYAKLFAENGLGEKLQDIPASSLQKLVITEEAASKVLLDQADEEIYFKAVRMCIDPKSSRSTLEEARQLLEDLHAKVPGDPALANNYASALSRTGRVQEAAEIIRDSFAQHPEYVFGAANYLKMLLSLGKIREAGAVVKNYRIPQRIHPDAYLSWMRAELAYFTIVEDSEKCRNIQDGIGYVQKQFGRK